MSEPKAFWFPAKRYGWGWGLPVTWQGWAVIAGYLLLLGVGALLFPIARELPALLVYTGIMTAALVIICYLKGEPPAWRWGGK
jgi:hypothetical protein